MSHRIGLIHLMGNHTKNRNISFEMSWWVKSVPFMLYSANLSHSLIKHRNKHGFFLLSSKKPLLSPDLKKSYCKAMPNIYRPECINRSHKEWCTFPGSLTLCNSKQSCFSKSFNPFAANPYCNVLHFATNGHGSIVPQVNPDLSWTSMSTQYPTEWVFRVHFSVNEF